MKSKQQKREEALIRSQSYAYDNSKAKRNGVDQDKWLKHKENYEERLQKLLPTKRKR